jgi:hypothetical protein
MEPLDKTEEEQAEHPKGTLAVVSLYGVLMVLGWLAIYFFAYLPRGAVTR